MKINSINNQNQQNFGSLYIKGGKKGARYFDELFKIVFGSDLKSAQKVVDSFEKAKTEQANNPLFDLVLSRPHDELDSMDESEYFKAEIVNKKTKDIVYEKFLPVLRNFDDEAKQLSTRALGTKVVKWMDAMNEKTTNRAKVSELSTKTFNPKK